MALAHVPPPGLVDADALMRVASLELRVRLVMDGLRRGLHRGIRRGHSVEFAEYRQYVPGDDPRFIDWRMVARSDRDYVKQFLDETSLRCTLVMDVSRSMAYGSTGYSKGGYAATLAATLAAFLLKQGDAVGLMRFSDRVVEHIPARQRPGQLRRLVHHLDRAPQERGTDLNRALAGVAGMLHRRGLVILFSDLLAPVQAFDRQLAGLSACGHDVVVFQVLDPAERTFTLDNATRLRDMESGQIVDIEPTQAKAHYQTALQSHLDAIAQQCRDHAIEYHRITTDSAPAEALAPLFSNRRPITARGVRR